MTGVQNDPTPAPACSARSAFVAAMVVWINARFAPPGVTVNAETPLFKSRILTSIRILDLIAWTERETGRTIPDRDIRMDNFQTIARIAELFVEDPDHVGC